MTSASCQTPSASFPGCYLIWPTAPEQSLAVLSLTRLSDWVLFLAQLWGCWVTWGKSFLLGKMGMVLTAALGAHGEMDCEMHWDNGVKYQDQKYLAGGMKQVEEAEDKWMDGDCDRKRPELMNWSFSWLTYPLSRMCMLHPDLLDQVCSSSSSPQKSDSHQLLLGCQAQVCSVLQTSLCRVIPTVIYPIPASCCNGYS